MFHPVSSSLFTGIYHRWFPLTLLFLSRQRSTCCHDRGRLLVPNNSDLHWGKERTTRKPWSSGDTNPLSIPTFKLLWERHTGRLRKGTFVYLGSRRSCLSCVKGLPVTFITIHSDVSESGEESSEYKGWIPPVRGMLPVPGHLSVGQQCQRRGSTIESTRKFFGKKTRRSGYRRSTTTYTTFKI